jgi:uncharacterized membrane protein YoaK (UPF0700 family)
MSGLDLTGASARSGNQSGLLGRVNSAYRLLAWGTMPLGAAAGGLLAQWLGLQAMFAIMGLLTLALLTMMPILMDKAIAAADAES